MQQSVSDTAASPHPPTSSRLVRLPARSGFPLWAVVVLGLVFFWVSWQQIPPHDFWWHVRVGEWIAQHGEIPAVDLFSFTAAGMPWIYQSWLVEVVYHALMRVGGLPLVLLLHALTITAGYGILLAATAPASPGRGRLAVLAVAWAAALGWTNWNVRPQGISFPLLALTVYAVERAQRNAPSPDRPLWPLVPLFAMWANAHGGFVFGLVLVGAFVLGETLAAFRQRQRPPVRLWLAGLACGVATLATPWHVRIVHYVLSFARHPITTTLNVEFMPPTVRGATGLIFFAATALLVGLFAGVRYRPPFAEAVRLLVFFGLALAASRSVVWFGFVAAPTVARALRQWRPAGPVRPRRGRLDGALMAVVVLLCALSLPWLRPYLLVAEEVKTMTAAETPIGAAEYLRSLGGARRVFHDLGTGSYMIWASPEIPVFIDTRFELYPEEHWRDYLAISAARYDWEELTLRHGIDTLLLPREGMRHLVAASAASPAWRQVYGDEYHVIFVRERGTSAPTHG